VKFGHNPEIILAVVDFDVVKQCRSNVDPSKQTQNI
jgi:hypothetical protein